MLFALAVEWEHELIPRSGSLSVRTTNVFVDTETFDVLSA